MHDFGDTERILFFYGEYILYLRSTKLTSPALHVKINDQVYYGDMFPTTPVNTNPDSLTGMTNASGPISTFRPL